jgi:hypothetical protein
MSKIFEKIPKTIMNGVTGTIASNRKLEMITGIVDFTIKN